MKEPIDKLIKEKLYDHESSVPKHLWEQLAADLDKEEKKKPVYWQWAAVILLLIGSSLFMLRDDSADSYAKKDNQSTITETEIEKPAITSVEKEEKTIIVVPEKAIEIEKRQLVVPVLTANDSRALAISSGDKMELIKPENVDWESIAPLYKEEGRVLVSVRLAKHSADEMPENSQKKSWRTRIQEVKNADKKIRIPKPNISFAELFAAK